MVVYVRGVGLEKIKDSWTKGVIDLAREAALKALEDANVKSVDYIIISNMTSLFLNNYSQLANAVRDAIGLRAVPLWIESACGSGGYGFHLGYRLVKSGARNVLVVGVEKMSDHVTADVTTGMMLAEDILYTFPSGSSFVSLNALALKYYMSVFDVPHEDIMLLPVLDHEHAVNAPHAQFPFKITLETVKKSPLIADPLHLFESSGTGDGAAAVLLSSEKGDVEVKASTVATDRFRVYERENLLSFKSIVDAAREVYRVSSITPSQVDVIEIHDAFSITGIIALEDLGFAKKGEGVSLLKKGSLDLNGEHPTNTFGGLKARGHPVGATGVYQIAEITLQLRGEAGKNQVDNAKIGLAQNIGAIATSAAVTILSS